MVRSILCLLVVLVCGSLHMYALCVFGVVNNARFCVVLFFFSFSCLFSAVYKFSFIHSFIHSFKA